MNWTNIKRWAKEKGYKVDRKKSDDEANPYNYEWHRIDNAEIKGTINSLSKLAMSIYNDITNNKHVKHQEAYRKQKEQQDIQYDRSAW